MNAKITRRHTLAALALAATALSPIAAHAEDVVKIGVILPMTGQAASTGREIVAAIKLFQAQKGDKAGGKKVEVIVKDDTGVADITKRLAQELVVNDKVAVIAGFGMTPLALAAAPIATQAKVPEVVMAAGTAIITEASPFVVRTSFTLPQNTMPIAQWAVKNGIKKVVTLVSDYGPGIDAEKTFVATVKEHGGQVLESLRAPLKNPEFAPFLQKAKDLKPDALFLFVPSGQGAALMKQVSERDFAKEGIKVIGTGDVTDDEQLNGMGDPVLGMITSMNYSADHDSPENKAYVAAFEKANAGMRPNFMSVGGYDGMALIYAALDKTKGDANGAKLVEAMKGMSWTSPRGPISIDPETRDIVQNVYIRKVEKKNGQLYNVEFDKLANVKDPFKAAKAAKK
ncbi:MAG: ABC transporter substrate-binding protein [Methylobacteriaceae bacterium]|nr:ABC transporter substrate-binding protein [Methylobacteriaceae bacterium]